MLLKESSKHVSTSLPCQSVLGLNCAYLCLLFVFLGHQKHMQLLAIILKGGSKKIFA